MVLIQLTGLSGAGKSTLAFAAQEYLIQLGHKVEVIDGDAYRLHLCQDLGFSKADRMENIRRLGFVGLTLAKQGVITILAAINPYEEARSLLESKSPLVKTVSLSCPLEVLVKRDVKGLYKRALLSADDPNHLENFTGISDPYEIPQNPHLVLHTHEEAKAFSTQKLIDFILQQVPAVQPFLEKTELPAIPKAFFVGRWQPFHNGHKWLIDNKLKAGVPVLIGVRDIPCDAQNPFTTAQTTAMIRRIYTGQAVTVMALPDIESINYGRSVGYAVNCFLPPSEIGGISATFIRECLQQQNDAWKDSVDESIHEMMAQILTGAAEKSPM